MQRLIRMRERGASGLEYAGFVSIAALVVMSVFLGIFGSNNLLASSVTNAICRIFTLGQGSCTPPPTAADRRPPEPCVVSARGHDSLLKAGVAVAGSGGESWNVEQLSDGTFRVTRGTTKGVSVEGGPPGFSFGLTVDNDRTGTENALSGSLGASLSEGEVYSVTTTDGVSNLLRAHTSDVAKDMVLGSDGSGAPGLTGERGGITRWAADRLTELAGVPSLPEADATFVQGGISARVEGAVLTLGGAQGAAGIKAELGTRIAKDGATTAYYSAALDVGASAQMIWLAEPDTFLRYAKAGANGSLGGVVEVNRNASQNVTSVVVKLGGSGDAYAEISPEQESTRWEQTVELPVRTAEDQRVVGRFLSAMNMDQIKGLPAYIPNPLAGSPLTKNPQEVVDASREFFRNAMSDGYVSKQKFTDENREFSGDFDASMLARAVVSTDVNLTTQSATSAEYFNGSNWVPWSGCGS